MLREFKEFAVKGNEMDMAVGIMLAAVELELIEGSP